MWLRVSGVARAERGERPPGPLPQGCGRHCIEALVQEKKTTERGGTAKIADSVSERVCDTV